MKTPDEIKKMLKKCPNADCSLCQSRFHCDIEAEALEYIQQLERERDAAVEQLRKGGRACSTCKFSEDIPENDKICEECRLTGTKLLYSNWEWVGPQEVE